MTREQRRRGVGLLLFLVVCFVVAAYYFKLSGANVIPGSSAYQIQAIVPTAVSLAPSADVREYGVSVGKVDKIAATGPGGDDTALELELDSHSPVFRDARIYIRAKSVAGENYVELDPGTRAAGALPSGSILGVDRAQDATQIDQIFSIFNHARRRDVQHALAGLSGGLQNGGQDLNSTLESLSALPNQGANAAAVLAHDRAQLGSLIDTFGTVTRAIGERQTAIQEFTRQVKVTAQAVAARDSRLEATLGQLPPFLTQARATADRLLTFSREATPVVHNLRLAATDLVPTVDALLPAAQRGQTTVSALDRFAVTATPALRQLSAFSGAARQFVPSLAAFLEQARPMATYLSPYFREVGSFFAEDAASFQPTDHLGHVARIVLPISQSDLAGVLTPAEQALLKKLEGSFDARGVNAYPSPGHAASGAPYDAPNYPQLQADPAYGQ